MFKFLFFSPGLCSLTTLLDLVEKTAITYQPTAFLWLHKQLFHGRIIVHCASYNKQLTHVSGIKYPKISTKHFIYLFHIHIKQVWRMIMNNE